MCANASIFRMGDSFAKLKASGALIARPVAPLGDGMIGPHHASCTLSAEVLCHTLPGPARGAWTYREGPRWAQARLSSDPERLLSLTSSPRVRLAGENAGWYCALPVENINRTQRKCEKDE